MGGGSWRPTRSNMKYSGASANTPNAPAPQKTTFANFIPASIAGRARYNPLVWCPMELLTIRVGRSPGRSPWTAPEPLLRLPAGNSRFSQSLTKSDQRVGPAPPGASTAIVKYYAGQHASVVRQKFLNMIFGVNGPSQF